MSSFGKLLAASAVLFAATAIYLEIAEKSLHLTIENIAYLFVFALVALLYASIRASY
jgi:hypothetical protein